MNIFALNWQDLKNPMSGGAEVHLEELLRRVVARGHSVTLFCSNFPGGAREEEVEGIRIVRAGARFNFNLVAPFHVPRLLREKPYDLFIEDINKIPFYTPLYQKLPSLVIVPHLFSTTVFREINFVLGSYIYLAEMPLTAVYRRKRFCVISESTAADMAARGIPKKNISVIHCGIDASVYNNRHGYAKCEHPSVLYLGRIKKYKSIQHLVAAYHLVRKTLPQSRLAIVGAGDFLPALKQQAQELGIDGSIDCTGFVPEAKKVEYLCRSHVMVYPSLKEGWGLTNIEANSCGTAVVAADTPGLRDSVKDGQSGLLYEYGNIEQLAEKILTLLTDDALRRRLEQGGKDWAAQFNWDDAADKFLRLCLETAGRQ